jgi:hypothetical protein
MVYFTIEYGYNKIKTRNEAFTPSDTTTIGKHKNINHRNFTAQNTAQHKLYFIKNNRIKID